MPSDKEQIATAKSQILQIIVDITANPKPSYSIDGQSVSWNAYMFQLKQAYKALEEFEAAEEPYELSTYIIGD